MKRSYLVLPLVIALLAVAAACTPTDVAVVGCTDDSRPIYRVPANPSDHWPSSMLLLPDNTTVDARGRTFDDSELDEDGFAVGVKFHNPVGSRDNLCMLGGTITSSLDPENTSWSTWHRVAGMTVLTPNFQVIGTRIYNQGDGVHFDPTATNWKVTGLRIDGPSGGSGYIHDDCIQNDSMNTGVVDDSKFDGCTVFMSSMDNSAPYTNGGSNRVEVKNSLVWVRPFHNSYNTTKYGFNRHGGFFKWAATPTKDGVAPKLTVRDSVFRSDDPAAYGGNANGFLGLPPGTTCTNVTLINTHTWPADELASWTSQCTNLTLATTSTWNAKVATWDADHPVM
jgi:hypothetical protein